MESKNLFGIKVLKSKEEDIAKINRAIGFLDDCYEYAQINDDEDITYLAPTDALAECWDNWNLTVEESACVIHALTTNYIGSAEIYSVPSLVFTMLLLNRWGVADHSREWIKENFGEDAAAKYGDFIFDYC